MKGIDAIREMVKTQCSDGNWNYDPYMHGMANGMILCLAVIDDVEPDYLDAPDEWLCDKPTHATPETPSPAPCTPLDG